ncbi:luciferin sulfotransferase-like [Neodiprion virginianus]|uniref:luciferin sulfotransferase-like n=1 Tax=Neodiprion virginianus TaxID=2961670 RepID=UPI001EE70DCA|nr:luciferin sulfotransferase-like [Neodiprion virginianus]
MAPQIQPVDGELGEILKNTFTNDFRFGYVTVDGVCLPKYYEKFAEAIENFEVRDDDIWVCSFPKTGTTWTQEMVWCIANDLDFEGGKVVLSERFPFLDFTPLFDYREIAKRVPGHDLPELVVDSVNFIRKLPSPRYIKTHLPFQILPRQIRNGEKKPKIIYVARNPKDTCVSYCHHCKLLEGYRGSFDDFCKLFLADKVNYAPFWKHVLGFWEKRNDENMLFLKYQDMKADLPSVIRKTAEFLGKVLTNEQLTLLTDHLSFASMKANPAVNYEDVIEFNKELKLIDYDGKFMRSGTVDQWKGQMSSEVIKQFDDWINENLKDTGLSL